MSSDRENKKMKFSSTETENIGETCKTFSKEYVENDILPLKLIPCNSQAEKFDMETRYLTDMDKFLPAVAWKLALEKLEDEADIQNCSNSSPYFQSLLATTMEGILLPQAFYILAQQYLISDDECYKETNLNNIPWKRPESKPKPHQMTGIWKCGLVCKSWNQAIEEIHQSSDVGHFDFHQDTSFPITLYQSSMGKDIFVPEKDPNLFMEHFDATHYDHIKMKPLKNPFIGRWIDLSLWWQRGEQRFAQSLLELLAKYGQEIWFCDFSYIFFHGTDSITVFYEFFRNVLWLLPNLKSLRIIYNHQRHNNRLINVTEMRLTPEEMQELEQAVSRNGLPKLRDLILLSSRCLPTPVFNHFLENNKHVCKLAIYRNGFHEDYKIFNNRFTDLTDLSLDCSSKIELHQFKICKFNLNLENITLSWKSSFYEWSQFLRVLLPYSQTLKKVSLTMPAPKSPAHKLLVLAESLAYRLKLPKLEEITISSEVNFCLDFLLRCKDTLKSIYLCCNNEQRDDGSYYFEINDFRQAQKIKFLGYKDRMEDSNIREKLQKLEFLRVVPFSRTGNCVTYDYTGKSVRVKHWTA